MHCTTSRNDGNLFQICIQEVKRVRQDKEADQVENRESITWVHTQCSDFQSD